MARGYNNYNRTFMVKEGGFAGAVMQRHEAGSHWHRTDIIRLRHNPLFRRPGEKDFYDVPGGTTLLPVEDGVLLQNASGFTMIECWVNGEYRWHEEFSAENFERRQRGCGVSLSESGRREVHPREVHIDLEVWGANCGGINRESDRLDIVITGRNSDTGTYEDILKLIRESRVVGPGGVTVFKSGGFGGGILKNHRPYEVHLTDNDSLSQQDPEKYPPGVKRIIIRSGAYIDGLIFELSDGQTVQFGACAGGGHHEFTIDEGDSLDVIMINSGGWIDGLEFVTKNGKRSGWFGGHGGELHT
ncbi:hypothetical protein EV182_007017, partial [Spiromyces aspiralis]